MVQEWFHIGIRDSKEYENMVKNEKKKKNITYPNKVYLFSNSIIKTLVWSNLMLDDLLKNFLGNMWVKTKYVEMAEK